MGDPVDLAATRHWRDTEWQEFAARWAVAWNARNNDLPDTLYHYTTPQGVRGILGEHKIWGTDARFVNDTSELTYADGVIEEVAAGLQAEGVSELAATFLQANAALLSSFSGTFGVYIACFCTDGDRLSQWRGYPADGVGFALGFDPGPMRLKTQLRLRHVIYDRSQQQALVHGVLSFVCGWLAAIEADVVDQHHAVQVALHETNTLLSECAFCFKHPSFAQEDEWRLVHLAIHEVPLPHAPILFRDAPTGLVPYVDLRPTGDPPGIVASRMPLKEIVVGPTRHPDLAQEAVEAYARSCGYSPEVTVRSSDIPLRV